MPATTMSRLPPPKPNHDFTRRPSSKLGIFFWRQRMWFESTFVFSMLEPWEKIMLCKTCFYTWTSILSPFEIFLLHVWFFQSIADGLHTVCIFILLFVLLVTGIVKYLPHHLRFLSGRTIYYLWGREGDERLLWQWLGVVGANTGTGNLHKELWQGKLGRQGRIPDTILDVH